MAETSRNKVKESRRSHQSSEGLNIKLERRNLRYVRYADDFSIYTTSDQAARIDGNYTRKTAPYSFDERIRKLKEVQRGWVNYFRMASIHGKLKDLDSWVRNRLRYCIWKNWKRPERRRKNLIQLGVDQDHAYQWSRTRMGGWAVAQSPILVTTITLKGLARRGYVSSLEYYLKVSPQFNEPLYTRPVRTVV